MDLFESLKEVVLDSGIDCVKMLPFLFAAFLLIEGLEHYSGGALARILKKVGVAGPLVGAIAGCVPQCGFSVMAAIVSTLVLAGCTGVISPGTLLSVFIATSDEAILIIMGSPGYMKEVGALLAVKVLIGASAGYLVDLFLKDKIMVPKEQGELCTECGCQEHQAGILLPAWRHTIRIFVYLFLFTCILHGAIELLGVEKISTMLLGDTIFQPVAAAVIGLIPNCAASVLLTQLYLSGAISFASVIAGLCTGAGVGLVVLFKMNHNRIENLKIVGILLGISIAAGIGIDLFV